MSTRRAQRVARPRAAPDPASLPHPITFFVSVAERRRILVLLRAVHRDRAVALRRVVRAAGRRRGG